MKGGGSLRGGEVSGRKGGRILVAEGFLVWYCWLLVIVIACVVVMAIRGEI